MQNIMNEFKKIAPYIADAVKARVAADMSEAEVLEIIHQEIIGYFEKGQKMAAEVLTFNVDQRATFAAVMYELLKPLAAQITPALNPKYEEYVARSGKTGAFNFITNA